MYSIQIHIISYILQEKPSRHLPLRALSATTVHPIISAKFIVHPLKNSFQYTLNTSWAYIQNYIRIHINVSNSIIQTQRTWNLASKSTQRGVSHCKNGAKNSTIGKILYQSALPCYINYYTSFYHPHWLLLLLLLFSWIWWMCVRGYYASEIFFLFTLLVKEKKINKNNGLINQVIGQKKIIKK